MPKIKQAQKQARNAEKRQLRNRRVGSRAKTFITRAEKFIFSGEIESAQAAVAESISALDRAAEKRIIHPNNAARRKSRLMKKLNQVQAKASAAEVIEEEVAEVEGAEEKAEKKPKAEKKKKSK
ncbi:MAG: 30S ribosomal protein S20 [Dehalococcoidales bacterium]|nr:30S ribosomal protein S20 [Dehalococcoidales bacterium]